MVATIPSGQAPQGMVYVPEAVPEGTGTDNLVALVTAGEAVHLTLGAVGAANSDQPVTTVAINAQGLTDLLQAAVTGLEAQKSYVLALSGKADGSGPLEDIATFMTNPAGAAVVTAIGPIRKVVAVGAAPDTAHSYLVIAAKADGQPHRVVQVQRS